jgi:hypothetical protein
MIARLTSGDASAAGKQPGEFGAAAPWPGPGASVAPPPSNQVITGSTDPRWVLALRAAESLHGAELSPDRRHRLVRLGRLLGLSAFDSQLIIAIVQEQARRGYAPACCPTAGGDELGRIPLPSGKVDRHRLPRALTITCCVTVALAIELLLLARLFTWS